MTQPWDSANNRLYASESTSIPFAVRRQFETDTLTVTNFLAIAGPRSSCDALSQGASLTDERLRAKAVNVEVPTSDIPWTEPRDITINELMEWQEHAIGHSARRYFPLIVFADGRMYRLAKPLSSSEWLAVAAADVDEAGTRERNAAIGVLQEQFKKSGELRGR